MNEKLFFLANSKKKTNHILHLILTLLTFGFWVIVWVIVAINNNNYNSRIESEMGQIMGYKEQGLSDVQTYRQIREDKARAAQNKAKAVIAVIVGIILVVMFGGK